MRKKVMDFLGVHIPEDLNVGNPRFVSEDCIGRLIWEKPPKRYLARAALYDNVALGVIPVTVEMCEGHFPFFSMLPLAILAQAVCQVGELMIVCKNNIEEAPKKVPLVVKADEVKCISKDDSHRFMVPGDNLLVVSNQMKYRSIFHELNARVYCGNTLMASIASLTFVEVELSEFLKEAARAKSLA